ncbi:MAG TPA: FtsX-like permease family protein [Brumimicrobium sp.]|nr:FtsX-like permease family protein [Brumimicrobium sp.]
MNKIYYIAKKIHKGKSEDKKVSQPITRIARLSIILAMAINIITIAVVTGFQNEVKDKVIGFGSHATIVKAGENSTFESAPIVYSDSLIHAVQQLNGVKNIQPFAYKPALLQSDPDTNRYQVNGIDTFQVQQEIHGIVMKGVGKTYDWTFFESHLVEGVVPNVKDSIPHDEVIVSSQVAKNLSIDIGDDVNVFFVKTTPVKLKYKVTGIFKTGLQEFDEQVVIGDMRNVQRLNDWGIQTAIRVADTITKDGQFIIYADARGGNGNYRHDWGRGFENARGFTYCDIKDTVIRLITSDYNMFVDGFGELNSIPDTAFLKVKVEGNKYVPCFPKKMEMGQFQKEFLNPSGTLFAVDIEGGKRVTFEYTDGKGSHQNYIGGYEVEVEDFSKLDEIAANVKRAIYFQDTDDPIEYRVRTISEDQQEIFLWLDFLNLNVIIILVLMLLISTINMGSGLLVLIITKTQLIGLLKAIGTNNWDIRKLFLYQAVFIILRGVIIGNIIGIGLCLLQSYFTIIPLNPEVYYLDAVPVELNFWHIGLLNLGTIILCTAALIVPSYVVTKISPIKALKFD